MEKRIAVTGRVVRHMPDATADRWPRFEVVTFSVPTGIPNDWDRELVSKGAPKDLLLGAYQAANELALVEVPGGEQLACFGTCGRNYSICLNPRTGAVVNIIKDDTDATYQASDVEISPIFVNSSLDQFIASVRAVVNRFPFDIGEGGDDPGLDDRANEWAQSDRLFSEWDRSAEDLLEILGRIDPAATADLDGFWATLVSDVQMGDYSTKMVLSDAPW